jgi:serine/threonine protein kinase
MGVVVKALHLQLQEHVAIKLLRPEAAQDELSRARFLREARASARLRSEHVVRLMDFGLHESGSPILVMEYLDGSDLGSLLAKGPLSVDDTVEYMLQAAEGIAEAHAHGLVHRDLKPGNLFVTRTTDGSKLVKVLDFGVSKLATAVDDASMAAGLTDAKSVVGSPGYMSPEQLSGDPTDVRTDVWALGVIVFECLTGCPPFDGRTVPQLFSAILDKAPARLDEYREDLPACLQDLVDSCLKKNAKERCPTAASFAEALVQAAPTPHRRLRVERIARLVSGAEEAYTTRVGMSSLPPDGPISAWSRKRSAARVSRKLLWGASFGVVVIAGMSLLLWTQVRAPRHGQPEVVPVSAPARMTIASTPSVPSASSPDPSRHAGVERQPVVAASSASASASAVVLPTRRWVPTRPPPPKETRKTDPLDGWEPLEQQP